MVDFLTKEGRELGAVGTRLRKPLAARLQLQRLGMGREGADLREAGNLPLLALARASFAAAIAEKPADT